VAVINAKEEVSDRRWQWTLFANPARRAYAWDVDKPNRLITASSRAEASRRSRCSTSLRRHFRESGTSGFYE